MKISEQDIIRRVLAGEPDVYRVLMEMHLPAVLRMTLRVTGSVEDGEEAAQEAFLRAYNKLATFREHATFGTWVYRIAMNCSLNLVERRSRDLAWQAASLDETRHVRDSLLCSQPTPEALMLEAEAAREREHLLGELTAMERSAFVLRHLEDQPVAVIAESLGLSVNNTRQTIFRAASKLRRRFAPAARVPAEPFAPTQLNREPR